MNNKKIKIYISCHKKCELLTNECILPIQVGAALATERFPNMLHDDEGENISELNPMYCELTAQYWAWKNEEADYYGFMHYRRYFSFNSALLPEDGFGNIVFDSLNNEAIEKLCLDEKTIKEFVPKYDIITLIPNNMEELNSKSVYDHAKSESPYHRIEDLDEIIKIISEKYPQYNESVKKYLSSSKGYFCNMYILKKEIFQDYCSWLFDILETHRKSKSFEDYTIDEYRVSGFWAERLWGIYFTYLKDHVDGLKYKEIQKTFFKNTDIADDINPAFSKDNVPIVFSADNNYVPILATTIKSVIENANPDNNYDFVILQQNITEYNQERLKNEFIKSNVSLRFVNVKTIFERRKLVTPAHFTIEIYFRLAMQDIMKKYDKVIYLDSDLVVNADISELYEKTPIGENLLAAVQDVDSAGCYKEFDPLRKEYFDKYLKLDNPYSYFNSGVLIMNLKKMRETYTTEYILKCAEKEELIFPDQDVLNILCEGKVYYLDESWNTMMNHSDDNNSRLKVAKMAPRIIYLNYLKARKNPKIVHFAGYQKPWQYLNCDMSDYFWKYARRTMFYEEIITKAAFIKVQQEFPKLDKMQHTEPEIRDFNGIKIDGIDDSIYLDGLMIKFIKKINKAFPMGSSRRERLKRIMRFFVK